MIYLFNSAYRKLYFVNVLNTLYLPSGCTNEYRYRISQTEDDLAVTSRAKRGERVCVVYADRWAGQGYRYIPLRTGRIASQTAESGREYFRVFLEDFIAPPDYDVFNRALINALASGSHRPDLTQAGPSDTNDGNYAARGPELCSVSPDLKIGTDTWAECVAEMASSAAMKRPEMGLPLFVRSSLRSRAGARRAVSPTQSRESSTFVLNRDERYLVDLSYVFPAQQEQRDLTGSLRLLTDDNTRLVPPHEISVSGTSNRLEIPFGFKRHAEDAEGYISIGCSLDIAVPSAASPLVAAALAGAVAANAIGSGDSEDADAALAAAAARSAIEALESVRSGIEAGKPELVVPDATLVIQYEHSSKFWLGIFALILLFSVGSVLASWPQVPNQPPSWSDVGRNLLGVALQGTAAFVALRRLGKRFL